MKVEVSSFIRVSLLVSILLSGCSKEQPVKQLTDYHGWERAAVIAELGEPTRGELYRMKDAAGEFRIELQNTYPLSDPANAGVEIEELWWDDGDYWITLWLHQADGRWVVLDSCRWDKDVVF